MSLPLPPANYQNSNFQPFYTNAEEIRSLMLHLLGDVEGQILLEPCAGEGAFLTGLSGIPERVDAIDIDTGHIEFLRSHFSAWVHPIHADFIDAFISRNFSNLNPLREDYDAIICNPPYGLKFSLDYRKRLKRLYPNFYVRESYGLFMVFALTLLRPEGRYVFIVPDTFLTSHLHRPLRDFLAREARPTHLIQFRSRLFETVSFGYGNLCIIAGQHESLKVDQAIHWVDALDHKDHLSPQLFDLAAPTDGNYLLQHAADGWVHPTRRVAFRHSHLTTTLGEIAECRTGIYTGDNQRFYGFNRSAPPRRAIGQPLDWDSEVRIGELSDEEKRTGIVENPYYVPLIKGGHREPFSSTAWAINWSQNAVAFYATDKKARLQNPAFYFRKGLAVPMVTSGRISASLMQRAIFDQGVVGVFPYDENLTEFLLIYLNSDFVTTIVKSAISPGANNSANYIKRIPIPILSQTDIKEAHSIVAEAFLNGWDSTRRIREKFLERFF